jgi:hypothetical protein
MVFTSKRDQSRDDYALGAAGHPQGLALFFGLLQAAPIRTRRSRRELNTRLEPLQLSSAEKSPLAAIEKIERCPEKNNAAAVLRASVVMMQTYYKQMRVFNRHMCYDVAGSILFS